MNNYNDILLNRLHRTITEKNKIENESIRFLSYDITIEPKIVHIEKKNSILCTIYFYVKAPLFDDVFFDSSSSIASEKYGLPLYQRSAQILEQLFRLMPTHISLPISISPTKIS